MDDRRLTDPHTNATPGALIHPTSAPGAVDDPRPDSMPVPDSMPRPARGTDPDFTPRRGSTDLLSPECFVRDLDIRRAILAVLLRSDRELGAGEVVDLLRQDHGIELAGRQKVTPQRRVSDTLRALERRGWCRRVRRGQYVAVPSAMSPSRRWRSLNWRRPTVRFTLSSMASRYR